MASVGNVRGHFNNSLTAAGGNVYAANTTATPSLGTGAGIGPFNRQIAGPWVSSSVDNSTQRTNVTNYVTSKWGALG